MQPGIKVIHENMEAHRAFLLGLFDEGRLFTPRRVILEADPTTMRRMRNTYYSVVLKGVYKR